MANLNRESTPAGADHPASLNQRLALRAVGQKDALPPKAPGPLVDQDGDESVMLEVRQPLVAAPMPVYANLVSESGAARLTVKAAETDQSVPKTSRQQRVDLKAFTGKGDRRVVRQAMKAVDDIHAEMAELAQVSVLWGKRVLYLTHHTRSLTQQHSLRWRGYSVVDGKGGHKHLSWDEAADRIRVQPYEVQIHFHTLDSEARRLNAVEQEARAELKRLRSLDAKAGGK